MSQTVPSDLLFYDGTCGLCHRTVRFVLAYDTTGTAFRFAPIDGDTFRASFTPEQRADLPDSILIRTADGRTLTRYAAVLHIGARLGGWRARAAQFGWFVPVWLGDFAYDAVARLRRQLFQRPEEVCPVTAPDLRARFDP